MGNGSEESNLHRNRLGRLNPRIFVWARLVHACPFYQNYKVVCGFVEVCSELKSRPLYKVPVLDEGIFKRNKLVYKVHPVKFENYLIGQRKFLKFIINNYPEVKLQRRKRLDLF